MKADWTCMDHCDMARRSLSFTPGEIDLIQSPLQAWRHSSAERFIRQLIGRS